MTITRSVAFEPRDPSYEARVRASFDRQRAMHTIGARLVRVEPGEVELELPFRDDLTQQHGFLHAGIITTLVDSACGYAAPDAVMAMTSVVTIMQATMMAVRGRPGLAD
jgi:acyl-coenzyme A thioesterase PaaI-like protein